MKKLLILTVVLLIAGFVVLELLRRTRTTAVEPDAAQVLVDVPASAIERLAFRNWERGGGEVIVARRHGSWVMESPFQNDAEDQRIENILRVLTTIDRLAPFESSDAEEELGLGRRLRGRIDASGAFGETRIEIGIRLAALDDDLVVRRSGWPEPAGKARTYRFPQTLWNVIDDTPFNFRRKSLSPCDGPEIRRVRMERSGAPPIVLEREDAGPFSIASPYADHMDRVSSVRLAGRLAGLRVDQVLYGAYHGDDGGLALDYDPVKLGLEPPSFVLTFGDGATRSITLHIGLPESALSEATDDLPNVVSRWYARLPGGTDVFMVREDPLIDLLGDGTGLRPRGIGRAFASPIARASWRGSPHGVQGPGISLRMGRGCTIEREEGGLRMTEPLVFPVDDERFAAWLLGFAALEAQAFRLREQLPAFEPAAAMELVTEAGERVVFEAGEVSPRGEHLVAFGHPSLLAVLDASTLAMLWPNPETLLERRLLPCDASDVTRLTWTAADAPEPAFDVRSTQPLTFVDGAGQGLSPRDQERIPRWLAMRATHRLIDVTPVDGDPVWTLRVETRAGEPFAVRFFERGDVIWASVNEDPIGVLPRAAVAFPR